ncbi:hypothetical protein QYF61_014813 [Mycteria americana]|uniref:Uncharacterized protein n=1 Tax=Mycteria americana TaxID=33587 RepID=A0AAN7MY73_MYCAM|nr:hypothetical protein QYF61_014813 [Mycteria americana]
MSSPSRTSDRSPTANSPSFYTERDAICLNSRMVLKKRFPADCLGERHLFLCIIYRSCSTSNYLVSPMSEKRVGCPLALCKEVHGWATSERELVAEEMAAEVKVAENASQWLEQQQVVVSILSLLADVPRGELPTVLASPGRAPKPSLAELRSGPFRARGWRKG